MFHTGNLPRIDLVYFDILFLFFVNTLLVFTSITKLLYLKTLLSRHYRHGVNVKFFPHLNVFMYDYVHIYPTVLQTLNKVY